MLSNQSIFDIDFMSQCRQSPICGIEELACRGIILRPEPLGLQYPPKRLHNIEMRRVWWKEEQEQPSLLPNLSQFRSSLASVYGGIVKHNDRFLSHGKGETVEKIHNLCRTDAGLCGESVIDIATADHAKYIKTRGSLGGDIHILSLKLPRIGYVPLRADMALVAIIQIYAALRRQAFKFLQLLALIGVELRRRLSLWAFSYTLISCTNALKKRLKVMSPASLPVASCQACRALLTLWRSSAIAAFTASSSEQSIIGFLPRPGLVYKPLKPSERYLFNHEYTLMALISVSAPTALLDIPCDFNNIAWQRMRKQWLSPLRKPSSSFIRSQEDNSIVDFLRLIFITLCIDRTKKFDTYYV